MTPSSWFEGTASNSPSHFVDDRKAHDDESCDVVVAVKPRTETPNDRKNAIWYMHFAKPIVLVRGACLLRRPLAFIRNLVEEARYVFVFALVDRPVSLAVGQETVDRLIKMVNRNRLL